MLFFVKLPVNTAIAVALLFIAAIGGANASELVFVESYGGYHCSRDVFLEQEELSNLMETQENVILVNCKNLCYEKAENIGYGRMLCRERGSKYSRKFGYSYTKTPMVVVNGRWDSNPVDLAPAIALGRLDKISPLFLALNGNDIDIKIPKIEAEQKSGVIMLFSYIPVLGIENNDDRQMEIKLRNNMEGAAIESADDPYIPDEEPSSFFRSVLTMEKLGEWSGEEMSLSYSLDQLANDGGMPVEDLGYVVVLFAGEEDIGEVLAAGEIVSYKELSALPKSEPVDIEAVPFSKAVMTPAQ